jgi:hypothetical protein
MTLTKVHVFWDDGAVISYRFNHRLAARSFINEIHGRQDGTFGSVSIACVADGGRPARSRARSKARQLGAVRVTEREVTRAFTL